MKPAARTRTGAHSTGIRASRASGGPCICLRATTPSSDQFPTRFPRQRGLSARPPARPSRDRAQREGVAASRFRAPARPPPRDPACRQRIRSAPTSRATSAIACAGCGPTWLTIFKVAWNPCFESSCTTAFSLAWTSSSSANAASPSFVAYLCTMGTTTSAAPCSRASVFATVSAREAFSEPSVAQQIAVNTSPSI